MAKAWEKSAHGRSGVGCPACHTDNHDGAMAAHARRNTTCLTGCHERERSSYTLSKHGVIATLETERMDFSLPLKEGNQRSPSCAYCHLHDQEHDAGRGILPLDPSGLTPGPNQAEHIEARVAPCRDCHSPRFVDTWFSTGDRTLEIGRMKLREAEGVVSRFDSPQARTILRQMKERHLKNMRLGVGHASPDDLWWHGQAALDGDLARLKSLMSAP
ncbi:MAG: hypothetical protein HQM01_15555 [Magnetococcales bacterium]|nr:hypothetical protein [Magnetococcales bacterium]